MQEREVEVEREEGRPRLRRLEFVHVAAAQAALCLAGLYALARDHSGPLRPGVDAVESAVRGVAGPVVGRFKDVPLHVLAFVDRKVRAIPPLPLLLRGNSDWLVGGTCTVVLVPRCRGA